MTNISLKAALERMWQHILSKFEDVPTAKEYYDEDTQTLIILHNKEITFYINNIQYKCEYGMALIDLVEEAKSYYSIKGLHETEYGYVSLNYKEVKKNKNDIIQENDNYILSDISDPS